MILASFYPNHLPLQNISCNIRLGLFSANRQQCLQLEGHNSVSFNGKGRTQRRGDIAPADQLVAGWVLSERARHVTRRSPRLTKPLQTCITVFAFYSLFPAQILYILHFIFFDQVDISDCTTIATELQSGFK